MRGEKLNILVFLFVIILIINNWFFFTIPSIYYAILIIYWILYIPVDLLGFKVTINFFLLFYFACICSLLVNEIPERVEANYRFTIFAVMTSLLGPFISSVRLDKFRITAFNYINIINLILCSLSFLLLVIGLHQGQKMDDRYGVLRSDFAGLYGHSMVLGPMAAIGVLYSYYIYRGITNNKKKVFIIIILILCFLACLKAGSRTSVLGLTVALPFLYYKFNDNKLSKLFMFICGVLFILLLAFPLYEAYITRLLEKFDYSSDQGSVTISRDSKWLARISEFLDSPFFGVGYANVTHEPIGENGNIEPGSSWLSILSMTGLFGFLIFLYCYFKIFASKIMVNNKSDYYYLLLSVVLLLSIYMIFEGVIMVAGTLLSAFIWLSFGILSSKRIT